MENTVAAPGGRGSDPEAQAGRALRRLRLARSWSQEEVAERMSAYGYDFHQTTIAKIEAAQRPLRVRELADFAALYGVEVQELVYAPSRSLTEIVQEIDEVEGRLAEARMIAASAREEADAAHATENAAQARYVVAVSNASVLEGRLSALRADKEDLSRLESDGGPLLGKGAMESEQDASGPVTPSVAATAEDSSTVLRILLGAHLRRLRESCDITPEDAGASIRSSRSKISRYELGRIRFKERDVADLLTLYGVTDDAERRKLLELARKSNTPDWWHEYSDVLPDWFEAYIALEAAATAMQIYEAHYIPDLLQTDEYSRALISQSYGVSSEKEIDRAVQFGAARRERLLRRSGGAPRLHIVLDEVALQRQVGSEAVMRTQLGHIAEIARRPNVTIQVMPLQAQGHHVEGFRILQFGDAMLPELVYIQQLTGAVYHERRQEVEAYKRVMYQLSNDAFSHRVSAEFLDRILAA